MEHTHADKQVALLISGFGCSITGLWQIFQVQGEHEWPLAVPPKCQILDVQTWGMDLLL